MYLLLLFLPTQEPLPNQPPLLLTTPTSSRAILGFAKASPTGAKAITVAAGEEAPTLGQRTKAIKAEVEVPAHPNEMIQVGGRLVHFQQQWTFNPWAHSVISCGLGWRWKFNPPPPNRFFQSPTPFLEDYVQDLLRRGVIMERKSIKFQGRLFCIPEKLSSKERVILDLSLLNTHIQ